MVKIVNGVVVQDGGASGSSSAPSSGGFQEYLQRSLRQEVSVGGRRVRLYVLLGAAALVAFLAVGPVGAFYVLIGFLVFSALRHCGNRTSGGQVCDVTFGCRV